MAEACYEDESTVHSLRLSDLYKCVCGKGKGVSSEIQREVAPWIGRSFFQCKAMPNGRREN